MATRNIFLEERGFGSVSHGEATGIAGADGQMLSLRHVIMPDNSMGGQLTIVPLKERNTNSPSNINSEESVYEIKVVRNSERLSGGSVRIRQIDCITMEASMFDASYFYESGGNVSFVSGAGMRYADTAIELLTGVLSEAFHAVLDRANNPKGQKLYFGILATDVAPLRKQWFNKETRVFQDAKPVYSKAFLALAKA